MNSFDLLLTASTRANWTVASEVVVLCHFLDQIEERCKHDREDGLSDYSFLAEFRDYLEQQISAEMFGDVEFREDVLGEISPDDVKWLQNHGTDITIILEDKEE